MTKAKDKSNHPISVLKFPTLKYNFLSFAFFFLIIFSFNSFAGNYYTFNENFKNTGFSINKINSCFNNPYTTPKNVTYLTNSVNAYNVTFINDWFCWKRLHTYTQNLFLNESVNKNSKFGLNWNGAISSGSNADRGIYSEFPNVMDFVITDNSYIELYCSAIPTNQQFSLQLLDDQGNFIKQFELSGGTNTQCLGTSLGSYNCCDLPTNFQCPSSNTITKIKINKTAFDYCNITEINNVKGIGLRTSTTSANQYIDDISLFMFNGSNQLPIINTSFNVECLNNSENANIQFNISANDYENDNIYYSFNKFQQTYLDYTITFSQLAKFSNAVSLPNYVFGSMLNNNSNECVFTDSVIFPNPNEINLVYHWSIDNSDKHMINLKNCLGKESIDFNLKQSYSDMKMIIPIYDFKTNNEAFNVSFYNFDKSILINKFGFKITNNVLNFSEYNGSKWISIGTSNITQYTKLTYFMGGSTGQPLIYITSLNNAFVGPSNDNTQQKSYTNLTILDTLTNVNRIVIDYDNNSNFFIESFDFTGVAEVKNYSVNKPTFMNVSRTGNVKINIYVSDTPHLNNNEYSLYSYNVNVQDCRNYIEGALNTDDISRASEGFDPIAFFNALLGKPFRSYMNSVDSNNIAQLVIWWVYLILFIGSFVSHYMLTKIPDIIMPLGFSSLVVLFISILGAYIPSILVSGIGLALVFMAMFTNTFKGGTNG